MTLLSSRATVYYKRILPIGWFGLLAAFLIVAAVAAMNGGSVPMMMVVVPIGMAGFGYYVFRKMIFDMVDEVWDDGQTLVVRSGGKEERIALSDISNVSYSAMVNPPRVTLSVRRPTVFGSEITFCGPLRVLPFSKSPIIDALIERIDATRRRHD